MITKAAIMEVVSMTMRKTLLVVHAIELGQAAGVDQGQTMVMRMKYVMQLDKDKIASEMGHHLLIGVLRKLSSAVLECATFILTCPS